MPKKKPPKSQALTFTLVIIAAIVVVALALYFLFIAEYARLPETGIYVSEVIDGDTFEMSDKEIIRLLCVDTPEEGEAGYEEAKSFLAHLVLLKEIRFEYETDRYDKYNRTLAFVYVNISDEEIFVNKEVVRLGFGELFEYGESDCSRIK